jgi:hypothetical protein
VGEVTPGKTQCGRGRSEIQSNPDFGQNEKIKRHFKLIHSLTAVYKKSRQQKLYFSGGRELTAQSRKNQVVFKLIAAQISEQGLNLSRS